MASAGDGSDGAPAGRERWLGRALVEGAIAGVIAPVVVVVLVAAFAGQLQSWFREPTCDDPKDLVLLTPASVEASGGEAYADAQGTYPASNAMDTNSGTAWVEGVDGYGTGEWLRFRFADIADVQMLCVVNGYAQSARRYAENGRVRQVELSTDQGTRVAVLSDLPLDEVATFQRLHPPEGPTTTVTLTIRSTSSMGGSEVYEDTAISEVEFWGR